MKLIGKLRTNFLNIAGSLHEYLANTINTYIQNADNFRLIESGTNATLAGYPAYKLVFNQTIDDSTVKTLEIGTLIGNKAYYIQYYAESQPYSDNSRIAQFMINSFNLNKY